MKFGSDSGSFHRIDWKNWIAAPVAPPDKRAVASKATEGGIRAL